MNIPLMWGFTLSYLAKVWMSLLVRKTFLLMNDFIILVTRMLILPNDQYLDIDYYILSKIHN